MFSGTDDGGFYIGDAGKEAPPDVSEGEGLKPHVPVGDMHPLFCEMAMLDRSPKDGNLIWKEAAR